MLNLFSVVVFHRSYGHCLEEGTGPWYMCILLYVKLLWCSDYSIHLWSIGGEGDTSGISVHSPMYVKHIQCSSIPYSL